jgi:hypothetical protein
MTPSEPRNPLYLLLLLVGVLFCVTALAYAVLPVLEEKAKEAGGDVPPSPFRKSVTENGGVWLLMETAALIVLGLASMAVDHYRRIRAEKAAATPEAPPSESAKPASEPPA